MKHVYSMLVINASLCAVDTCAVMHARLRTFTVACRAVALMEVLQIP